MLRKLTVGLFALALVCLSLGCSGDKSSGKDTKKDTGKREAGGGGSHSIEGLAGYE